MSRTLDLGDVEDLALGCSILSTGGGGAAETEVAGVRRSLRRHGPVPLVDLAELDAHGIVMPLSAVGAPTAAAEMVASGDEARRVRAAVEGRLGRNVTAVMATEIGGGNGVSALGWAAELGLPLVDADGMGRAFPEVQMVSMHVVGRPIGTVVLADTIGNVASLESVDPGWAERWARALCVASGSSAVMTDHVMRVDEAVGAVVSGSVSLAVRLGSGLRTTRDAVGFLATEIGAVVLAQGRVDALDRITDGGFVRGAVRIVDHDGRSATVDIQNEYLRVRTDDRVLASTPDLVAVLDAHTDEPLATERLRFGQRVKVLAWPCDPLWRTPAGLAVAGPGAFGYDDAYLPVEQLARR